MGSIKAQEGEDWTGGKDWDFPGLFYCLACGTPYPTQREADLCTPAFMIPVRYGVESVTEEIIAGLPPNWLDELD